MRDQFERDERVMTLVAEALEQEPGTRAGYLQTACGADADLYAEVAERVDWERRMGGFLRESIITAFDFLDRPFEPGEFVADRFRIGEEIGRGGMGVVYEAYDERLSRRVAIKSAQAGYGHWLPPEVRAAREVSHFNVCKVHDLHSTVTDLGEVEFLTMEFIEGETLSARIQRTGPLSPEEAKQIARQICAGLAQAHRQGVIHGDLKCGNIILTRTPEGATRAVITDFGLAAMSLAGEQRVLNRLAGSLDYMAPELFAGSPVSAASDLYALGVVLHVMLTGKVPAAVEEPISAETASTVTLSQTVPARYVRRRVSELPAPWKRIVLVCMNLRPEDRFGSAEAVVTELDSCRPSRKWWPAIPAAAALIVGAVLWLGRATPGPPVRLAILPIAVEGAPVPAAEGLGVELADRLSGARRGFLVIPPGEAQRNRVNTPQKARTVLAATHALRTRVRNEGGPLVVEASVVDTSSAVTLQELRGTYAAKDVSVVAKALTATVTSAFHLRSRVPMEVLAAAAYPAYVQGLNLLRRDNASADEAIPFLEQAIALDPRSALPYAALAEAELQKYHQNYGYDWLERADQSVSRAQSLNGDSPLVLLAAGLLKQQHGWYEQAAEDFNRALELSPNNAEAWNRLAMVYSETGRRGDAINTYQRAIAAQPAYYQPYWLLGQFYFSLGEFSQAEELFRRMTDIVPGLAAGYVALGFALEEQGRFPEAEQALQRAVHLQETSPALTDLGFLYYQQERFGEASGYFERSLKAQPPTALRYADLGDAYRQLGRNGEALDAYRKALAMDKSDVARNPRDAFTRAHLACIFARLGDHDRAEFEITQALNISPGNTRVIHQAILTFEALGERGSTLHVLAGAPPQLVQALNHYTDLKDLRQDSGFQELLSKSPHQ